LAAREGGLPKAPLPDRVARATEVEGQLFVNGCFSASTDVRTRGTQAGREHRGQPRQSKGYFQANLPNLYGFILRSRY
jgi:hypothetical protein